MHTAHRAFTVPAALLVVALSAGCGGGGGGSHSALPVVTTPVGNIATSSPAPAAPASTKTAAAQFSIRIPAASASASASKRSPAYISAATQSITVSAVGSGTTASATINVGSSSCTSASGTQVCTATVQAPIGADTFTVTTYDSPNGTGNVLSTGTVTATIVAYQTNVVPLTLGGTIASLAITIDTPNLPVIDGGTANATVVAKDASGNQIVGTYSTAIALSAASGLTLAASSIADSGHATVGVRYDGVSKTALAITATSGSITGLGSIVPTSHVHIYANGVPAGDQSNPYVIVPGPDGALYFGDIGLVSSLEGGSIITPTNPGAIGRLDPKTGQIVEIPITGIFPVGLMFIGNDLYFAEMNSGSVGKITNAGAGGFTAANYAHLVLPNAPPPGTVPPGTEYDGPRTLAYIAATQTLYVTCMMSSQVAAIDLTKPWGTQTGSTGGGVTYIKTPSNTPGTAMYNLEYPDGMTLGADGNLYIAEGTRYNPETFAYPYLGKLVPGATSITDIPVTAGFDSGGTQLRFVTTGPDGNIYISELNDGSAPSPIISYDGTTFKIASSLAGTSSEPDYLERGTGTTIVYPDLMSGAGVGVYDTSAQLSRIYPIYANIDNYTTTYYAQGATDGGGGNYYFTFFLESGVAQSTVSVGVVSLAQGWQLLPEQAPQIDGTNVSQVVLGVAELSTQHDTVTVASTTPTICSVAAPSGFTNTYVVSGVSPGTCTVTATDQTGRVVTKSILVTTTSITVTSKHRRVQ